MPMNQNNLHVAVVGAGIIGICCASVLRRRGVSVTLIDRDEPCSGTSSGNAGAIAVSEILPLASPGIMAQTPKWLLDPLGPLSVRPTYFPKLVPWLYRFWRASTRQQVRASATSLAAIMKITVPAAEKIFTEAGIGHALRRIGEIHVYQSRAELDRARWGWDLRAELGIHLDYLDQAKLRDMEPALDGSFTHGVHQPDWIQVTDPYEVGRDIANHAIQQGVNYIKATVRHIGEANARPVVHLDNGKTITADRVVLAAGAWSHRLAARWGEHIPLETERGYNTTMKGSKVELNRQVTFGVHGFVASPLSCGLRIGGAVELGGLEAPPNYARADAMLNKARKFLPGMDTSNATQWMGYRPSIPDSLPVIGKSTIRPTIIHAYGHGHLGLALAPATAELVADTAMDSIPAIDIHPFRPDRF